MLWFAPDSHTHNTCALVQDRAGTRAAGIRSSGTAGHEVIRDASPEQPIAARTVNELACLPGG